MNWNTAVTVWKWFWNGVEPGKGFECILEEAKTALKKDKVKGDYVENSDVNEKHALGNRGEMILPEVAKNLAELCCGV